MWTRNSCSKIRERRTWVVDARPGDCTQGHLRFESRIVPCALGKTGITTNKREGDGGTPAGTWEFLEVRYRADRVARPQTRLPVRQTQIHDGWCDARTDRNYNRPVVLPYSQSAESMWRDDHIYDVVVVLSHNQCPRSRNRGSAVFVHIARDSFSPTEGCVAFLPHDLRQLMAWWRPGDRIQIRS